MSESTTVRYRLRVEDRTVLLSESEIVLGRSPYCTVVLTQDTISRVHASLRVVGARVEIRDHASSNGTYVNGKAIRTPTLVGPSDDIRLGKIQVRLEVASMRMSSATGHIPRPIEPPAQPQGEDTPTVWLKDGT
jgi:pSer/pThr/pTyr-binding forkhead associated (FHA) protein